MFASPGVGLRCEDDDSSVTQVSSLGFVNADGIPVLFFFQIQNETPLVRNQQRLF